MPSINPIGKALSVATDNANGRRARKIGPPAPQTAQSRRLRKATGDFEALFLSKLLKPLEKAAERTSSGNNLGGGVMMGVALEKMAETMAQQGGIGLGELLYESMQDRIGASGEDPALLPESNTALRTSANPTVVAPGMDSFLPDTPTPVDNPVGSPAAQPINKTEGEKTPNLPAEPIE